jgi:hypothetical protein
MRWLSGLFLALPSVCWGGSVGVGAGVGLDMPDVKVEGNAARGETTFGPSPNLLAPLRLDVARFAAIRVTVHAAFSQGRDYLSWAQPGVAPRVAEQPKRAWLGSLAGTVGPEVRIPVGGVVEPYIAGGAGVGLVYVWHNIDRVELLIPEYYTEERLSNPLTRDPFSRQAVFATDLALGATIDRLWFELGYSAQFVDSAPLVRSPEVLDVQREAFGWNALRLVVGFSFPVAGDR